MKKTYIGEIGELSVYMKLLGMNCEVYRANRKIQEGWDLVVILEEEQVKKKKVEKIVVKRIQVKTTILGNKSTNNSFKIKDGFNYLVLVVIDMSDRFNYYILTSNEVNKTKNGKALFSVTQKINGKKVVLNKISEHKDKWEKITQKINCEPK